MQEKFQKNILEEKGGELAILPFLLL